MVGPDFTPPEADLAPEWLESRDARVRKEHPEYKNWWRVFDDPVLENLVETAYEQNLPLRIAGVRVSGGPSSFGSRGGGILSPIATRLRRSGIQTGSAAIPLIFGPPDRIIPGWATLRVIWASAPGWELDFWGKFRRAIQSADANLLASVAAYDNVLVSLTADVARTYVVIRVYEDRLRIARENVKLQKEGLRIARARFNAGDTSERDVQQGHYPACQYPRPRFPFLKTGIQKAQHALSILLGMPPGHLRDRLKGDEGIPRAPLSIAVGIPAETAAPQARHPQRRIAGRQPVRSHRSRQGGSLSLIFPERVLWFCRHKCGGGERERHL